MKIRMSLKGFRVANAILLASLLLSAGNYYLDWRFFGGAAKSVPIGVALLAAFLMVSVSLNVEREMDNERAAQLEKERECERTRDKSNEEAESERLRRAIGMPPNKSLERTRGG